MITLSNIRKTFILKSGERIEALKDISISFPDKGIYSLLGRNGCGKSTLLNIIGGLDTPTSGTVSFNCRNLSDFSSKDFDNYRNEEVAYIFQDYNLIQDYSVEENVKLAVRLQQDEKNVGITTREALKAVGLEGFEKRKLSELSGGQRQRVVLARAIAKQSSILLCDEPTGNLDTQSADAFFALLKEISKNRLVIVVTHDAEFAQKYSDCVLQMTDGILENSISEFKNNNNPVQTNRKSKSSKKQLSFKNTLRYAFRNLKSNWVFSVLILLIISICLSLLTTFFSLSKFSLPVAMYNTATANGCTTISLTKYKDSSFETGDGGYLCGRSYEWTDISEKDFEAIKEVLGDKATIYKSYIFTEYFDYLTENDYDYKPTNFRAVCFNEFIAVDDFSSFKQELKYGSYPKEENQVLIYDYMAENMLNHGGFDGVTTVEEFVNHKLKDKYSGTEFVISGILKSNYELYKYVDNGNGVYSFETKYLATLQSMFGYSSFYEKLQGLNTRESVFRSNFFYREYSAAGVCTETELTENTSKPFEIVYSSGLTQFTFCGDFNPNNGNYGILISRGKLAEILGKSTSELSESYINDLTSNCKICVDVETSWVDGSNDKLLTYGYQSGVIGVYAGDSDIIYHYSYHKDGMIEAELSLRQFFVSLNLSDSENLELIEKLMPDEKDEDFLSSNIGYSEEGYCLYTAYQELLEDAVIYLDGMNDLGSDLFILSLVLVVASVLGYGFITIRKRRFEIGLFKSLGVSNKQIATIFGLEVIMIAILACILSLAFSPMLMSMIDDSFTSDLVFPVSFFEIHPSDIVVPIIIGLGSVSVSLIAPLVSLLRLQPVAIMRHARK